MTKINLIIGIVCGLLATLLVNMHVSDIKQDSVAAPYLTLNSNTDLVKGTNIEARHLESQALPSKFKNLSRFAIPDNRESRAWLIGRAVTDNVQGGSLLLHSHFVDDPVERFSAQIAVGKRAFTVPTNSASSVAYFIEPGSRVDVLGTFMTQKGNQTVSATSTRGGPVTKVMETRSLLQNLRVIAVDRATTRVEYLQTAKSGFSTITLEVSPLEAETLVFAQNESRGALSFVLRNPSDDNIESVPNVSWDTINR